MARKSRQRGITLTEMVIVVAAAAAFVGLAMPAMRTFFDSLASSGPAKPMISAALATARAIAVREQRYAGVRFQMAVNPTDPMNPLASEQYMVYIIQDSGMGLDYAFRAVEDTEPMKLPTEIGVMDLVIVPGENRNIVNPVNPLVRNANFLVAEVYVDNLLPAAADTLLNPATNVLPGADVHAELRDMTTFSIIFSPAGKLVVTGVRVVNRDGWTDVASNQGKLSADDIFNTDNQLFNHVGMFPQDCYWKENVAPHQDWGLGPEPSRTSFVIYERDKLRAAYQNNAAWTQCLQYLKRIHLNPYTGTMIGAD